MQHYSLHKDNKVTRIKKLEKIKQLDYNSIRKTAKYN